MSVNERIELALAQIVPKIWPLCCPDERPPREYIVYNPELEEAAVFADNRDQEWLQHMQVHLYTKRNYMGRRKEIRKALRAAGAVVTDIMTLHEKDSGYYHLCFSCIFEEDMEE